MCMPRLLGCRNCDCGNHRGCVMAPTPLPHNGDHYPWKKTLGNAKEGCPCIQADDERIAIKRTAKKAVEDEEKSVKLRLLAVEMALWGQTYEGSLTTRRPKALTTSRSEKIKSVSSLRKKRRLA